jgi:hypothetical protein
MQPSVRIGSEAHKELLCQFFMESHVSFDPAAVDWPQLDAAELARLHSLPFWSQAVLTERQTACTVQAWAALETDPWLHAAVALQGYEEQRHAALLEGLTAHYGMAVPPRAELQPPADAEWAFLCTGYSECFDAFFTFALFAIARDSGFFPLALIALFEPIMQEEARHILFFVNWEAYYQARRPLWQRPRYLWRGAVGRSVQMWYRLRMARGLQPAGDFTLKGHRTLPTSMSPRQFLELCLHENVRRLGRYDARLLRPRLVPSLAKALCRVLR